MLVTASFFLCLLSLIGDAFAATTSAGSIDEKMRKKISKSYWRLPLRFEVNQGQTNNRVKFVSRGLGYNLFLTPEEAVFSLWSGKSALMSGNSKTITNLESQRKSAFFTIQFMGSNPSVRPKGVEQLPIKTNYLIGNDPRNWRNNIPTYAKVEANELYPGIDMFYYGNQRRLEFDFVVRSSGDYKSISMKFKNVHQLRKDSEGNLIVGVSGGKILLEKPIIYQLVGGKKQSILGGYRLQAENIVGFQVASYDPKIPLVIDPVLDYSTYLGGTSDDLGNGIAVDVFGNAYVTGATQSTNFPTTAGALQENRQSTRDAFITKFNFDGTALVYSTYLGGDADDVGSDVAVDISENAYIVGDTESTDFPTTAGAFQENRNSLRDAFVTKLNTDGSALVYSTYLGGDDIDLGNGVALDSSLNAYVTGGSQSTNFPTTAGAFQETRQSSRDAFVTKLNSVGTDLVYSTYLGGTNNQDLGLSIAVDNSGNAHVTGSTQSTTFPTTPGAFDTTRNSFQDAFVSKLNNDGSALLYSTYLGGNADDVGNGIALDSLGKAYIAGATQSIDFPTTAGAFDRTRSSLNDVFVTKLETDASSLVYSTYIGGNSDDFGNGIAVDSAGNAYVGGSTRSSDFPTQDPLQAKLIGSQDAFVTKLNADGSALIYSTYLGGDDIDLGNDIAVDTSGNAYITGTTQSNDFPVEDPFQADRSSLRDAFVAKLKPSGEAILYSTYIGGAGDDLSNSIAIDTAGNAYIVGTTASVDFPTTIGAFEENQQGAQDAFVSKLDPFGDTFIYSTYLGGSGDDFGNGIAVDSSGNAYVTGTTQSGDFPTANAYDNSLGGAQDAFVTKLNSTGLAPLVYSTYLGGSGDDSGNGIAVDSSGNAHVTGTTQSCDFPTANAYDNSLGGAQDAFMAKFDPSLSGVASLIYSTYLGGANDDLGNSITLDTSGNAYVAGTTQSDDYPVKNPLQSTRSGGNDAFVTKFNSAGSALTYSTYLGGNMDDFGNSIAVDISGNAYIAGTSESDDFPTKDAFQANRAGLKDAFITKVNSAGNKLVYSSYLGGVDDDLGNDVALDGLGNAFVAGSTLSGDFPTKSVQDTPGGGNDGFVAKIQEAEGSDSTTTGTGGGGGGCFIGSASYTSPESPQVKLGYVLATVLVIFMSIMIMSMALFYLFRRMQLHGVVFKVLRFKRK
jgi:hypothetical protein